MNRTFDFYHALGHWQPRRDTQQWVLGTVFRVQGSAYRRAGAQMLLNDLGQQYGLLSGGCLEADLQIRARRVMQTGQPETVRYDSLDDDVIDNPQGLGCGGVVDILLQNVHRDNHYLQLDQLFETLHANGQALYQQSIGNGDEIKLSQSVIAIGKQPGNSFIALCKSKQEDKQLVLETRFQCPPQLLVVGGGVDAIPLAAMAAELGWHTTVSDPRPANARRENFPTALRLDRELCQLDPQGNAPAIAEPHWLHSVDAAIVMAHSLAIDATALQQLRHSQARYLALLGPTHRKQRVLEQAGISADELPCTLHGPAGLPIGGDLPGSIALSMLAQCHAVLFAPDNPTR